jgi:hypothetical protein
MGIITRQQLKKSVGLFYFKLYRNDVRTPLNIMASKNVGRARHTNFENPSITSM